MTTGKAQINTSIKEGDDDIALNTIIQQYIDDFDLDTYPLEWRYDNYIQLRTWAFPSVESYTTAKSKIDTADIVYDADLRAEGEGELEQYHTDYLSVLNRFPDQNPYSGSSNYTNPLSVNRVQSYDGTVYSITFRVRANVTSITVDGKYTDKRSYDVTGLGEADDTAALFFDTPGFYDVIFSGDSVKTRTFKAAKQGENTLYSLATISAKPMDCHRRLIARAIWQQN